MAIEWVRSGMTRAPGELRAWLLEGMPAPIREQLTGFPFPVALIDDQGPE